MRSALAASILVTAAALVAGGCTSSNHARSGNGSDAFAFQGSKMNQNLAGPSAKHRVSPKSTQVSAAKAPTGTKMARGHGTLTKSQMQAANAVWMSRSGGGSAFGPMSMAEASKIVSPSMQGSGTFRQASFGGAGTGKSATHVVSLGAGDALGVRVRANDIVIAAQRQFQGGAATVSVPVDMNK